MDFIFRPKSAEPKLVHMAVEQNILMWEEGFITLHHKGWVLFSKMEDLEPIYKTERVVKELIPKEVYNE